MRGIWAAGMGLLLGGVLLGACKREPAAKRLSRAPLAKVAVARAVGEIGVQTGDLIFHESMSRQSEMVRVLTGSHWTHVGVVFVEPSGAYVLEAVSPVKLTAIEQWIAGGRDGRYVIKRLNDASARLPPETLGKMKQLGHSWLGRPYDLRFRWDDQALYCSELAYKLFDRAAHVQLGKIQRASEMNLYDPRVQIALRQRFKNQKFDGDEPVITPDSLFNDEQLVTVMGQL